MPLSGLDPSMLIGFLCKNEADWIDLRQRVTELFKNHKMIFSIVDEPPSWSDVDDSLESMSEPEEEEEEEEDMPEDKDDSSHSVVGDEEVHVRKGEGEGGKEEQEEDEEEEDSDGDFFDAGEDAVIDDRVSSRAASKSGQSEGDTEDDPVGPMTPGPATTPTIITSNTPVKKASGKSHAVSFARTASASTEGEGDLDDEEWVDPTPIPATPLDATPPSKALFQKNAGSVPAPPVMAKTKSSSSNSGKSRKHRKEARAPAFLAPSVSVPFPSSSPPPSNQKQDGVVAGATGAAAGADDDGSDPSRRIPQMSTARARDGGRTQSGGVKGVIAPLEQPERPEPEPEPEPEPGPELELVEADPDADDF
jgi:cysteine protease ATG4